MRTLSVILIILSSHLGWSQELSCGSALSSWDRPLTASEARKTPQFSLAPEQIAIIEAHPEVQALRNELAQNHQSTINFNIFRFQGLGQRPNGVGEVTQSLNLIGVLAQMFPTSKFFAGTPQANYNGHMMSLAFEDKAQHQKLIEELPNRIDFDIIDWSERGHFRPLKEQDSRQIEMIDMKPVNWVGRKPNKSAYREQMRIPQDQSVAHIYDRFTDPSATKWRNPETHPSIGQIVKSLQQKNFGTVILTPRNSGGISSSFITHKTALKHLPELNGLVENVYSLQEILEGKIEVNWNSKNLIINDTVGKMSEIHGASDLAVVVGPINFFEALSVGTPTVLMANPNAMFGYSWDGLMHMSEIANQFENFRHITQWSEFDSLSLPENTGGTSPHQMQGPFKNLVETLIVKIRYQMNRPWGNWDSKESQPQ